MDSISNASARPGNGPATPGDTLPHHGPKLIARLKRMAPVEQLRVCYEAGPTGYELARRLNAEGISCVVIAPSLIPVQQGWRVKTDRRDALRLASLFRSGELTEVTIPAYTRVTPPSSNLRPLPRFVASIPCNKINPTTTRHP